MKLRGGINFFENGLTTSIRAMHLQTELFGIINENYNSFDKVGYQRKEPVVSSFAEYIGVHALSKATDDSIGRIGHSLNPLDVAIANKGYFQYQSPDGIKITRDGRFKLDKNGNLLTLENFHVLANDGTQIKLPVVPEKLEDVKIFQNGDVKVFNKKTNKLEYAGTLSVVTNQGVAVLDPNIKQGYNEYSNVSMHSEILQVIPMKRNFEANRQMFVMQNNNLSKAIQTLSS
jgi:flagellar basal body rod protein FlgG